MSNNPFSDSPSPLEAGHFRDNPYQPPQPSGPQGYYPRRGLVNHIRIIVILNVAQGILELIMGAMLVFMTFMFADMPNRQMGSANEPPVMLMVSIFAGLAGLVILGALLRFWAAIMNFNLKGRTLGIVSLMGGLVTAITFYCAPTSIGIGVYGLIVMFNQEVGEAFKMRTTAKSADEVLQHFNARPY